MAEPRAETPRRSSAHSGCELGPWMLAPMQTQCHPQRGPLSWSRVGSMDNDPSQETDQVSFAGLRTTAPRLFQAELMEAALLPRAEDGPLAPTVPGTAPSTRAACRRTGLLAMDRFVSAAHTQQRARSGPLASGGMRDRLRAEDDGFMNWTTALPEAMSSTLPRIPPTRRRTRMDLGQHISARSPAHQAPAVAGPGPVPAPRVDCVDWNCASRPPLDGLQGQGSDDRPHRRLPRLPRPGARPTRSTASGTAAHQAGVRASEAEPHAGGRASVADPQAGGRSLAAEPHAAAEPTPRGGGGAKPRAPHQKTHIGLGWRIAPDHPPPPTTQSTHRVTHATRATHATQGTHQSPQVTPGHPRSPQVTPGHPRSPQVTPRSPRSPQVTQVTHFTHFTQCHPRSRHLRSPQVTTGHPPKGRAQCKNAAWQRSCTGQRQSRALGARRVQFGPSMRCTRVGRSTRPRRAQPGRTPRVPRGAADGRVPPPRPRHIAPGGRGRRARPRVRRRDPDDAGASPRTRARVGASPAADQSLPARLLARGVPSHPARRGRLQAAVASGA